MKTISLYLVALAGACVMLSSCGTKQVIYSQAPATTSNKNPFGETYELPCAVYDTPEQFAATGIYRGSMNQKGEVQKFALANAQQLVRMKMQHAYKGMVSDYSSTIGNNKGNDIEAKMSAAGDQIIDVVVNNTEACCVKFGGVGNDGMIECYVGIKISKQDLSRKVAAQVSQVLTEDEKMRINFNEENYRKQMETRMQQYKEANQ